MSEETTKKEELEIITDGTELEDEVLEAASGGCCCCCCKDGKTPGPDVTCTNGCGEEGEVLV